MFVKSAILIGCGSIGKRHLELLVQKFTTVIVVDPASITSKFLSEKYKENVIYKKSLNECSNKELENIQLAVIANWGPDHFQTFLELEKLKIENFILEKPLVTSLSELAKLKKIVSAKKLNVLVNQGWQDTNLVSQLKIAETKLDIGLPVAIFINGGARCHSTAGSHYIHLANSIFETLPTKVNGLFQSLPINPRSKNLDYIDGNLFALYSFGKELSINFSNLSSISGELQIYYENALGILNESHLTVFSRDKNREYSEIITRYGPPNKKIFEGELLNEGSKKWGQLEGIYKSIFDNSKYNNSIIFERHCDSNKILLYALISNEMGKYLVFDQKLPRKFKKMKFRIS